MLITFQCPKCDTSLEIEADAAGAELECPTCKVKVTVPRKGPGPGVTIGGFRIEKMLGRGGMGEVYLARQLSMDRDVALKILPGRLTLHKEIVERFLREVRMLAKLEHPNIVTAHEAGEDGGVYFMAMAYVNGDSLDIKLRREGPVPEKQALQMILKIARALAYAWDEHRLIHRDVKPANIMVDKQDKPRLMDLGLSKSLTQDVELTVSGGVVGTPNFMSPEQSKGGDVDFRSDMYSLGATLYNMLTGQVPFAGNSIVEILQKQATEALPDPRSFKPETSEACVALLEIMLAKNPAQRHGDWNTLIADIDRVLAGGVPTREPLKQGESVLLRTQGAGEDHKRIVLTHTQNQRLHERSIPGARKPASSAPLNVGLILVLVGALLGVGVYAWKLRKPAGVPAPANTTAPVQQAVAVDRTAVLEKKFADAVRYAQESPDDLAGSIRLFELVGADGFGTEYEVKAAAEIRRLQAARKAATDAVMAKLGEDSGRLFVEGKADEAGALVTGYAGPLAAETESARKELADQLVQRAEEIRKAEADGLTAANAKLEALTAAVAADMLKLDFEGAKSRIGAAESDAGMTPVATNVAALKELTAKASGMTKVILDSFVKDQGQEIPIAFKTGRQTFLIQSVGTDKVKARLHLKSGYVQRAFGVSDLAFDEQMARLGTDAVPDLDLMRGLLCHQWQRDVPAERFFRRAGVPLGDELAKALSFGETTAREAEAEKVFDGLLSLAGLQPGPEAADELIDRIRRKAYPPPELARIKEAAARFRRNYGDTEQARQGDRLLTALERVNPPVRRMQSPPLGQVVRQLQQLNPQVGSLLSIHDITDVDVELDISKNAELTNILPLRGVPLTRLNLSDTKVSDLTPLKGMPLRYLNLSKCPVDDIDPLSGMPLEELILDNTKVRNIRSLKGMPLKILNLSCTKVDSLVALTELPLKWLDIGGCPVEDFRPLQGLRLEWLSLGKSKISDLRPLKGMPLTWLALHVTPVSDLTPLQGMPLKELHAGGCYNLKDLGSLKGMPLTKLTVAGCPIGDLSPIAGMPLAMLDICGLPVNNLSPLKGMSTLADLRWDDWIQYRIVSFIRESLQKGDLDAAAAEANSLAGSLKGVPAFGWFIQSLKELAGSRIPEWKTMAGGDVKAQAKTFNGHNYAMPLQFSNLKDAQAHAQSLGGHLATINSQEEMDWVAATFAIPGIPVRLGGTDEKKEGSWVWLTGEPWGFSNWLYGQPDNWQGNEHSVVFFAGGKWQDISTDTPCLFLLEWDQ